MKHVFAWFLEFISPKGKIGRIRFAIVYVCALVGIILLTELTSYLWYLEDPFPNGQFNLVLGFVGTVALLAVFFGVVPMLVWLLYDAIYTSIIYDNYALLILSVVAGLMFLLYVFQCMKRCRDMGYSVWCCLIPVFNPFVMLIVKSKKEKGN